jgi:hypothetical protein
MIIFNNGLSKELCDELCKWGKSYYYGRHDYHHLGFPRPVVTTTNASWNKRIIKDSNPIIIYHPPKELHDKVKEEIFKLNIIDSMEETLTIMFYVGTPGSYLPVHEDGFSDTDRKVISAYLNEKWSIENGGNFHYLDKKDNEWKTVVPQQGLLAYNDQNEKHYTSPVQGTSIRLSLQIFSRKDA